MTDRHAAHQQLERAIYRAWPSFESIEYDGWILRFADGYTKRANSVNPQFGSTLPVEEKIARCEAEYAARSLPTIFRLTPFSRPKNLDRVLAEAGYSTLDRTFVMTSVLDRIPERDLGRATHVSDRTWFAAFDRLRPLDPIDREAHHRIVQAIGEARCFATVDRRGAPIACGLGVLVDSAVGLFDLLTAKEERRRGHGTTIAHSILRWASDQGTRTAFLQVHNENEAAQRLYRRFGFEIAYPYWYRIAASPGPSQCPIF